jgi:hypothetical protein
MEEKLIKECPVCHSKNIEQDVGSEPFTMHTVIGAPMHCWRDGCHCENCGSKFKFNHVSEEEFREPEIKQKRQSKNTLVTNYTI